ncbi:MAG: hypothetical protein K6E62_00580 [Lachnospiraceae bacterium]|nr:hypothetical protein [Lachnospiraceae bacterium]
MIGIYFSGTGNSKYARIDNHRILVVGGEAAVCPEDGYTLFDITEK